MGARLFLSPSVLGFSYGPVHPFQLGRLADLMRVLGALGVLENDLGPIDYRPAPRERLERFHDSGYIDALAMCLELPPRERLPFGLGTGDNPVFPGLWEYCLLTVGGSVAAAEWIAEGVDPGETRRAFVPGGGLHHAHRARAAGFCYVNDAVLAIDELVMRGKRVLYVDVDAHHGDGVQEAFYTTDKVLTVSVHQDGRTLFPGTGFTGEIGEGAGSGYAVNVPLLPASGDYEYDVFLDLLADVTRRFAPDTVVTEIGVDSLRGDPLTRLNWSLNGLDRFLRSVRALDLPWLALGGGGYDRWNVIRGWGLVWTRVADLELPDRRPESDAQGRLPESWPEVFRAEREPIHDTDAHVRKRHLESVCEILQTEAFPMVQSQGSDA